MNCVKELVGLTSFSYPESTQELVEIVPVRNSDFESLKQELCDYDRHRAEQENFSAKTGQIFPLYCDGGKIRKLYLGVNNKIGVYDLSVISEKLVSSYSEFCGCRLILDNFSEEEQFNAYLGWYLGGYSFDLYKSEKKSREKVFSSLVIPDEQIKRRVEAYIESIFLVRNLVNLPANVLGPEELEVVACELADKYGMGKHIHYNDEIREFFPLVYAVGNTSPRRPRVIELFYGDDNAPKLTIVGKGVCFDTGGLDLKPHAAMETMKKDMGGAAHALGLAVLVARLGLPVRLRVIIPAVENSVSGEAFRLGDVFKSRKGVTMENGNTDAEGRMILADCLTLATESETPDLLVDLATLTGSARAALGFDVPAFITNNNQIENELKDVSAAEDELLWPLPLYEPYKKLIEGKVADVCNTGRGRGDTINAALFLREFIVGEPDWVHVDMYAWEQFGKAGRPAGGSDTGIRALFKYFEKRFS